MTDTRTDTSRFYLSTQIFTLAVLLGLIWLGLMPALLGGLLVYYLVEFGARLLRRVGIIPARGRIILLIFVGASFVTLLALGIMALLSSISSGPESLVQLLQRMADVVDTARSHLPAWAQQYLPENLSEWQSVAAQWLRENAGHLRLLGSEAGTLLVRIIFGMIIGGMIALDNSAQRSANRGPLAEALARRVDRLGNAFQRIIFSQVRISALNTFLTGLFLVVLLPLLGNPLPLTKTLIALTFVVGLLPIIGNLISNTAIFLVALSISPFDAISALLFLITIHKLEYFFNAHIIGTQIKAKAWEILLSMLVMEAAFGVPGLIAAPIYYAYIKDELSAQKLI